MKKSQLRTGPWNAAFTLVELLTVIAIIGILAAMILPAISAAKQAARKAQAKTEESQIVTAITSYEADYSRFPVTTNEQNAANANGINDFTTGLVFGPATNGWASYDNNSNVVAILMDMENFPNGAPTCNQHHVKNPRQTKYLNAKPSGYDPTQGGKGSPGVDNTGIYRDPWGNPYVITMDLSYDSKCSDILYCQQNVSQQNGQQGYNGLSNTNANGAGNFFLYNGTVMVWSAGPDGTYSSGATALLPPNKDNVVSWQ